MSGRPFRELTDQGIIPPERHVPDVNTRLYELTVIIRPGADKKIERTSNFHEVSGGFFGVMGAVSLYPSNSFVLQDFNGLSAHMPGVCKDKESMVPEQPDRLFQIG